MKKKLVAGVLAAMLCFAASVFAAPEVQQTQVQTNLVQRIRMADSLDGTKQETISDRVQRIMAESNAGDSKAAKSSLPKVAVMYVNNAKTTYDNEVDATIFKYLNEALPESLYELVDGERYVRALNQMGYEDISMAERADFLDAFAGSDIDYCLYLEVQPFIARDKETFFTVGKDIITSVPIKIINLGTGRYIYNGKYTEKASDSTVFGGIGNKSVALKAMESVGTKLLAEVKLRLPMEKSVVETER